MLQARRLCDACLSAHVCTVRRRLCSGIVVQTCQARGVNRSGPTFSFRSNDILRLHVKGLFFVIFAFQSAAFARHREDLFAFSFFRRAPHTNGACHAFVQYSQVVLVPVADRTSLLSKERRPLGANTFRADVVRTLHGVCRV